MAIDFLKEVKARINFPDYDEPTISGLIQDVKDFCVDAGVPADVMESEKAIGLIARGVSDLWNMGAGEGKWSEVFRMRLYQLQLETGGNDDKS